MKMLSIEWSIHFYDNPLICGISCYHKFKDALSTLSEIGSFGICWNLIPCIQDKEDEYLMENSAGSHWGTHWSTGVKNYINNYLLLLLLFIIISYNLLTSRSFIGHFEVSDVLDCLRRPFRINFQVAKSVSLFLCMIFMVMANTTFPIFHNGQTEW